MDFKHPINLDFSDLQSLENKLKELYKRNFDELQRIADQDSAESNARRSHIIGQNDLIVAITSNI
jgi:hypothetical protein